MTNFWSFTVAATKNRGKRSHLRVCGDSLTFASPSMTVHQHTELVRWLSFWLARHLTSAFMLLSADPMNISWYKQACTHDTLWRQRYVTT